MSPSKEQDHEASFKSLLEDVRQQLLQARSYLDLWEGLLPTTEEAALVLQRYWRFFRPVKEALNAQFFIKTSVVTDSSNPKAASIYRALKMLDRYPDLAPGLDAGALRVRLKKQKDVLSRIRRHRNQRAAHWDTPIMVAPEPVPFGEARKALEELENIFNNVSGSHGGKTYVFQIGQQEDLRALLDRLKEPDAPAL